LNYFENFNFNPYVDISSIISPVEFEKFCLEILKYYAEKEQLKDFKITHNKKIKKGDETYQIDIYAEYTALNVKNKVIIECKHIKRSLERDEVIVLIDKVRSLGANKGILISTSGFQKGCTIKAKENGIALLQILDKTIKTVVASLPQKTDNLKRDFYSNYPPYFVLEYSGEIEDFPDKQIYPTEAMEGELKQMLLNKHKGSNEI
jgi:hypothetical protein